MNGDADTLALKVLGGTDAGPAIDINVAVAKDARGKDRERHERTIAARHAADEFGAGEFRNVELLRAAHAIKNVARLVDGEEFEIDALHLHVAGAQCVGAVVEATGKGEWQTRRCYHFAIQCGPGPKTGAKSSAPSRPLQLI